MQTTPGLRRRLAGRRTGDGPGVEVNAAVYLFFRTRLNLRLADPSLTWLQIVLATSMVMASAFALDQDRAAAPSFTR